MKTPRRLTLYVACWTLLSTSLPAQTHANENWPGFRGKGAAGVSAGASTPTTWDIEKPENILWKTQIPGLAHSSPVIWGERIFVTTAVGKKGSDELKVGLYGSGDSANDLSKHAWKIYCLDKSNGKVLWRKTAHKGVPKVKRHTKATHANATPVTDGTHLVVFFGSEGLYGYDLDGNQLWNKDLGVLDAGPYNAPGLQWGFASSPVIHDGRVFVQCDTHNSKFVAAFDVKTGEEHWRTKRDDVSTWSTPTVTPAGQLVTNGWKHIGGYDLQTGKEIWKLEGGGDVPVPTPVVSGDLVYITNAHGDAAPLYAIRLSAKGDISLNEGETANNHIAWSTMRNGAYMQTPLVYQGLVYSCSDRGVLKCYDALNGKLHYTQRLGKGATGFTASPVAADGKIYFAGEEGDVYVVQAGETFTLLAENKLDDICMASPAISRGVVYFRTRSHIIAVGQP